MKYVKMLGLAAVAAMALMAFLGASSASATVLCKTATNPCGAGWVYTGALEGSLTSGSSAVLESTGENPLIEDTCTVSVVKGEVTKDGGAGVNASGPVNSVSFEKCTNTTTVLNGTGTLELEGSVVKAKGFEVTVNAGVSCIYSAGTGTTLGTFVGGNPAKIVVNAVVNKSGGSFLCPSDSKWTAEYTITGLGTLHSEPS
jgi:hypothetical protein